MAIVHAVSSAPLQSTGSTSGVCKKHLHGLIGGLKEPLRSERSSFENDLVSRVVVMRMPLLGNAIHERGAAASTRVAVPLLARTVEGRCLCGLCQERFKWNLCCLFRFPTEFRE